MIQPPPRNLPPDLKGSIKVLGFFRTLVNAVYEMYLDVNKINQSLPTVDTADSDWIEIPSPYKNSWVEFDSDRTIRYRKYPDGSVEFQGIVKDGVISSNILDPGEIPETYRPDNSLNFACNSNDAFGAFSIDNTGRIDSRVGSNVFLVVNCRYFADD